MPSSKGEPDNPELREKVKEEVKAMSKGGGPGSWSAWKAGEMAKRYEAEGGGYIDKGDHKNKSQKGPPEEKETAKKEDKKEDKKQEKQEGKKEDKKEEETSKDDEDSEKKQETKEEKNDEGKASNSNAKGAKAKGGKKK